MIIEARMRYFNLNQMTITFSPAIIVDRVRWIKLSMFDKSMVFIHEGRIFNDIYTLIYSIAFPSRIDEFLNIGPYKIRDLKLGTEYFETDEKTVIRELIKIIIRKCKEVPAFLESLLRTGGRQILYFDRFDYYFGNRRNIYGKCLMRVRDNKLYSIVMIKNDKVLGLDDMDVDFILNPNKGYIIREVDIR